MTLGTATLMSPLILVLASFRALETRRPLIRATNTGVSAIVDPVGRLAAGNKAVGEGYAHRVCAIPDDARAPPPTLFSVTSTGGLRFS